VDAPVAVKKEDDGEEEAEEYDEEEEQEQDVEYEFVRDVEDELEDEMEEAIKEAEERIQVQQHKEWLRTLREKRIILRYVHPQPVYLLFNPWNESTFSTLSTPCMNSELVNNASVTVR